MLEDEKDTAQAQEADEKTQYMQMLEKFSEEIKKVEGLEKRVERSMMGLHQESVSAAAILE